MIIPKKIVTRSEMGVSLVFFFGFFFLSVILAQVQGFQSLPSGLIFTSL